MVSGPEFCPAYAVFDDEVAQFLWAQPVDGTKLNGEPPAVVLFTLRQVVENLQDLRPVLEGSGRDADPCQRQLLGPSVITKMIGP